VERNLTSNRERADRKIEEEVNPNADWAAYHEREITRLERWLRALEMAGTAMTR
jgi:hypothetical protein